MALPDGVDYVIIGAGIHGLSTAYHLALGLKHKGQGDGRNILVIDKSVDALTRIGDRHYIVERGRVVWQGDSAELRADEDIQHTYLGV